MIRYFAGHSEPNGQNRQEIGGNSRLNSALARRMDSLVIDLQGRYGAWSLVKLFGWRRCQGLHAQQIHGYSNAGYQQQDLHPQQRHGIGRIR